ncbi:MAG: ABC transporter ATP-binding protein [Spirochaetales bacterium]|nr:ABC transporter ATP-binding protein [Spirochaetales bacterium]
MQIILDKLTKKFGTTTVVDEISLEIESGEFVAFLGPSGCGKTTTLLMTAGIYKPDGGRILFGNDDVTRLQPKDRNIGMVFQSYALYPHMTVFENIAFSMKLKKASKKEMEIEAARVAELLGIGHLLKRKPGELSGGQQQRVALGRALIKKPELLLFDEPLSNLDARLRITMRSEIKRLQKELGITCIYVTHDQIEAMTMADRVAVMKDGELQAFKPPLDLHDRPETLFIGQFVGNPPMNLLDSTIKKDGGAASVTLPDGSLTPLADKLVPNVSKDRIILGIRPEDVVLDNTARTSAEVLLVEPLGRDDLLQCRWGGQDFVILVDPKEKIRPGDTVKFRFLSDAWQLFDPESEKSLIWN